MIFLACPYTGNKEEVEARMKRFAQTVGNLERDGKHVVSTLFMHYIVKEAELPHDSGFWNSYGAELISLCDELYVLCLDGWHKSTGVKFEMETAKKLGKKVILLPFDFAA